MNLHMVGTYGAYKININNNPDSFAHIRIIDAAEISSKMALVVIKHYDGSIEKRLDDIDESLWDIIKDHGIENAIKNGVDITKEPFNSYIAEAYWGIIK